MVELELVPFGDLVIGTLETGGIPVEMRKRTCIAMELVPRPLLLFLDEPTTGLDSGAALRIGRLLRRIASGGRAVVATVHQPSQPLFFLFDYLILLGAGGLPVFCGELGERSCSVLSFFASLGYAMPPLRNPADFIIEVAGGRVPKAAAAGAAAADAPAGPAAKNPRAAAEVAAMFQASPLAAAVSKTIHELDSSLLASEAPQPPRRPGFLRETLLLADRRRRWLWRMRAALLARLLSTIGMAIVAGTTWYGLGLSQAEARLRLSVIFVLFLFVYFRGIADIASHFSLREVYYRERAQGLVSPAAWQASNFLVNGLFNISTVIVFVLISYPLCHFRLDDGRLGYAILLMSVWTLFVTSITEYFAMALPVAPVAMSIGSASLALGAFFAGFMIPAPDIPTAWRWLYYILWFKYPFEGLAGNELGGLRLPDCPPSLAARGQCFPNGDALLSRYGLGAERRWPNVGVLLAYLALFELLKAHALRRITWLRR
eukprot:tig00021365_g20832.t1